MSKISKIINFLKGFLMVVIGLLIILVPNETSYYVVCSIIGVVVTVEGFKKLFFYISSACHMVGGQRILVNSIVYIDLGFLSFFVLLVNQSVAMLYLVAVFILLGVIDILRSVEIKRNQSKAWFVKLIKGILTIAVGIVCFVFANSILVMMMIFAISAIADTPIPPMPTK